MRAVAKAIRQGANAYLRRQFVLIAVLMVIVTVFLYFITGTGEAGQHVAIGRAGAFFIGAMLAGMAGVLGGTMISVGPGLDTQFLLDALIVVIIGGMGSLPGAAIGAVLLGLVQSYSSIYLHFGSTDLSPYGVLTQFILVIAVLAVRPLGLFGRPA